MTTEDDAAVPHRILWDKWVDPLHVGVKAWKERLKKSPWEDTYDDVERPGQVGLYQGPLLLGPYGFIPMNELNVPSRNFNLWVGHASFDLDRDAVGRIMAVPGVEVIQVWSRYRFWLGIGKAFEENEVKKGVLAAATPAARPRPVPLVGLDVVRGIVSKKFLHWAVFVMENGKLDMAGGDSREEVEREVLVRDGRCRQVFTSWDEEQA